MGKKSQPKAPSANETAAAQTASNKETAYWNAVLNNVNQITPYGNLTYTQTGGGKTYDDNAYNTALASYNTNNQRYTTDARGNRINNPNYNAGAKAPKREDYLLSDTPPSFTSEIKLSPEQQKLLDTQQRSDNALASLGEQQIGRIGQSVSSPFSFDGLGANFSADDYTTASAKGEEALLGRLNPQFAQDEEALRSRLINQGIGQNSEAYNREMDRFNQAKNDARQQAVLGGQQYGTQAQVDALQRRNQAINEYTTQRNAPLNEYTALTSGQQVQNPQFNSQNYQGAQGTDVAGLINQQYQNQLGASNARAAGANSLMGGLFGLGGSFLGSNAGSAAIAGLFSDERLKENIELIGTEKGHNIYRFNYKKDRTKSKYEGVMAQEVIKTHPEAVTAVMTEDGERYMVNYGLLGLTMKAA